MRHITKTYIRNPSITSCYNGVLPAEVVHITAKEYFESVRNAVFAKRRLEARIRLLRSIEDMRGHAYDGMPHAMGNSDPMSTVDTRMDAESEAAEEMDGYNAIISDARKVCRGIRAANPSQRWGDVLEARYCDALDWSLVSRVSFVSAAQARADAAAGMDWVDMVGIAAAREGIGRAAR